VKEDRRRRRNNSTDLVVRAIEEHGAVDVREAHFHERSYYLVVRVSRDEGSCVSMRKKERRSEQKR
jgi:hypothetical protein